MSDKFQIQRWAINRAMRDARKELVKAEEAERGQPDNPDWQEWAEEARNAIIGLQDALETVKMAEQVTNFFKGAA